MKPAIVENPPRIYHDKINQLLVDIQSLDDGELSRAFREAVEAGQDTNKLLYSSANAKIYEGF